MVDSNNADSEFSAWPILLQMIMYYDLYSDANEEWLEEEITSQEVVLAKLHNLENPDKQCEERMWEVQRIKTALKRKHKQIRKQREEQNRKEEEELKLMLKEEQRAIIEQEELLRYFPGAYQYIYT